MSISVIPGALAGFAARARKYLVALASALGVALSTGLLTGQAQQWVTSAIALLGAIAVYAVPNAKLPTIAHVSVNGVPVTPDPPVPPPA